MELELNDPEAAEVVVKAVGDLKALAGAKMTEMDKAHKFGAIHDTMLDGLVDSIPDGEVLRGDCEAKAAKHALPGEARERMGAALVRKAAREYFSINDISDYDWEG
jgi:hypothetical protein